MCRDTLEFKALFLLLIIMTVPLLLIDTAQGSEKSGSEGNSDSLHHS